MTTLLISVPNEGKKIRHLLTALLKKKIISSAKVFNYAKDYRLSPEGKIIKLEQKLLIINTDRTATEILTFANKIDPKFQLDEVKEIFFN